MWTDETTLRERFADIDELARHCKFDNCQHGPRAAGCAIQTALAEGRMDARRLEGFLKLDEEIAKLRAAREKRQMTVERHARREQQSKSRRYAARRDADLEDEY